MAIKKVKSNAYLEAEKERDLFNQGAHKVEAKNLSCVVYLYDNSKGKPTAKGYIGRSKKPSFVYYFQTEMARAQYVNEWMTSIVKRANEKKPDNKKRLLKVGDVLVCSWGYEQTNIDYYLVTELVGKTMVIIREIASKREYDAMDRGRCIPDPSRIIGKPMRKVADGESVKINSFSWARLLKPKIVAGAKIYDSTCWSSYH